MITELRLKLAERRRLVEPDTLPTSAVFQKIECREGAENEYRPQVLIQETYGDGNRGETTWTTFPSAGTLQNSNNVVPLTNGSALEAKKDRRKRNDLEKQLSDALAERNGAISRNKRLHADVKLLEAENKALKEEVAMLRGMVAGGDLAPSVATKICPAAPIVAAAPIACVRSDRLSAAVQAQQMESTSDVNTMFACGRQSVSVIRKSVGVGPSTCGARTFRLSAATQTSLPGRSSTYDAQPRGSLGIMQTSSPRCASLPSGNTSQPSRFSAAVQTSLVGATCSRPSVCDARVVRSSAAIQTNVPGAVPAEVMLRDAVARPSAAMQTHPSTDESIRISSAFQAGGYRKDAGLVAEPSAASFVSAFSGQASARETHSRSTAIPRSSWTDAEDLISRDILQNPEASGRLVRAQCSPQEMESLAHNFRTEQKFWAQVSSEKW